jgi:hypothetical protein
MYVNVALVSKGCTCTVLYKRMHSAGSYGTTKACHELLYLVGRVHRFQQVGSSSPLMVAKFNSKTNLLNMFFVFMCRFVRAKNYFSKMQYGFIKKRRI